MSNVDRNPRGAKSMVKISSQAGKQRPRGFVPIGAFFIFGATMAAFAGFTLLIPGTFLDALWVLNKQGHDGLAALGLWAAVPFVVLFPLLVLAALGWLRRRRWGWALGITIIAINMAGDLGQIAFGEKLKGAVGVVIAGMLLGYITGRTVRNYFSVNASDVNEDTDPSLRSG